eukprot:CAMPEP_0198598824 /NCGR_PEP_ID=MMETSP1462-20131121/146195_1 /TAXON_ID=1333877 /ORGANISM="Brandtodinium nutriculum, Strain RCC3387" /LENGTH=146 /DNA_ID=CAMNT_0044330499 /DNA_START=273 /DNA_END=712 /DNA_ORIENTATION=+
MAEKLEQIQDAVQQVQQEVQRLPREVLHVFGDPLVRVVDIRALGVGIEQIERPVLQVFVQHQHGQEVAPPSPQCKPDVTVSADDWHRDDEHCREDPELLIERSRVLGHQHIVDHTEDVAQEHIQAGDAEEQKEQEPQQAPLRPTAI